MVSLPEWAAEELEESVWQYAGDGFLDDQLGDVEGFGWFGRYRGAILTQDSQGFKYVEFCYYESDAIEKWEEIEREYQEYLEEDA